MRAVFSVHCFCFCFCFETRMPQWSRNIVKFNFTQSSWCSYVRFAGLLLQYWNVCYSFVKYLYGLSPLLFGPCRTSVRPAEPLPKSTPYACARRCRLCALRHAVRSSVQVRCTLYVQSVWCAFIVDIDGLRFHEMDYTYVFECSARLSVYDNEIKFHRMPMPQKKDWLRRKLEQTVSDVELNRICLQNQRPTENGNFFWMKALR